MPTCDRRLLPMRAVVLLAAVEASKKNHRLGRRHQTLETACLFHCPDPRRLHWTMLQIMASVRRFWGCARQWPLASLLCIWQPDMSSHLGRRCFANEVLVDAFASSRALKFANVLHVTAYLQLREALTAADASPLAK